MRHEAVYAMGQMEPSLEVIEFLTNLVKDEKE